MRPTVNIRFINTGLDDRIVKSTSASDNPHPAKTEKLIVVQDKQKGTYMRHQEVNVPQSKTDTPHQSTQSYDNDGFAKKILKAAVNLKNKGVEVANILMKTSEDEDLNGHPDPEFFTRLYNMTWNKIMKFIKTPAYDGYQKFPTGTTGKVALLLGDENFEDKAGKTPGATHYAKYDKSLTKQERTAIGGYTYSRWTYRLNNWLRNIRGTDRDGKPLPYPENEHEFNVVKTIANNLDTAIEKYELEKPTVVYRTLNIEALDNMLKSGTRTLQDDGFTSTAVLPECFDLGDSPVVTMVIKVPAGKGHGAWLQPISRCEQEYEFLLARGTKFNIDSLNIKYDKNKHPVSAVMECTVIGHESKKLDSPTENMEYLDFLYACGEPPDPEDDDWDDGDWGDDDETDK